MARDVAAYAKYIYESTLGKTALVFDDAAIAKTYEQANIEPGAVRTTAQVADWYVAQARSIDPTDHEQLDPCVAPISTISMSRVPFLGDTAKRCGKVRDMHIDEMGQRSGFYELYDLRTVSVGGFVGRMTAARILWLFLKTNEDTWTVHVFALKRERPGRPNSKRRRALRRRRASQ